jgi:hypothetical protein
VDSAYFEVNTTVGIPDQRFNEADLVIYPNPARDEVYLSFKQDMVLDVTVNIYDLMGSRVISYPLGQMTPGNNTLKIGTSMLKPGMYLMNIMTGNGSFTKRLTIIK